MKKDLIKFENTYMSMWKTAKEKNISQKDVEKEIQKVRNEHSFLQEIQKQKMKELWDNK